MKLDNVGNVEKLIDQVVKQIRAKRPDFAKGIPAIAGGRKVDREALIDAAIKEITRLRG